MTNDAVTSEQTPKRRELRSEEKLLIGIFLACLALQILFLMEPFFWFIPWIISLGDLSDYGHFGSMRGVGYMLDTTSSPLLTAEKTYARTPPHDHINQTKIRQQWLGKWMHQQKGGSTRLRQLPWKYFANDPPLVTASDSRLHWNWMDLNSSLYSSRTLDDSVLILILHLDLVDELGQDELLELVQVWLDMVEESFRYNAYVVPCPPYTSIERKACDLHSFERDGGTEILLAFPSRFVLRLGSLSKSTTTSSICSQIPRVFHREVQWIRYVCDGTNDFNGADSRTDGGENLQLRVPSSLSYDSTISNVRNESSLVMVE